MREKHFKRARKVLTKRSTNFDYCACCANLKWSYFIHFKSKSSQIFVRFSAPNVYFSNKL